MKAQHVNLAQEQAAERARVRKIMSLALPGQFEEALKLALESDVSVGASASRKSTGEGGVIRVNDKD